ncbi:von Willebrand factor type A domain protein [Rubripirellula amarantea]|uniref:von Willebrand factor type A domain protein n=1 Tax=Rubripirellula amarantea TaxID=2527999 RepID=A0A5C5WGF7_9BACT|nr:VWA domain-containing protein [Rubripirellula amarantea]TWT49740.1 von Willebrand factor type A domain protein [Rubripirellula amarantea]
MHTSVPSPHHSSNANRNRSGATIALVVILLPVLFAISALAINVAYIESANTEIQIATDAAVRAAGRTYALTGDQDASLVAAQEAAARNPIGDYVLPISAGDLDFGVSDRDDVDSAYQFTNSGSGNSVRLTTRALSSGAVAGMPTVFPFFGDSFVIRPERTAICTQGVIDIALVVDRSGSMAYSADEVAVYPPAPASAPADWDFGDPVPPNARWIDLIASVQAFIDELDASPQTELLSLSTYNNSSATPTKLGDNYADVVAALNTISMNFEAGGTNIGQGMYEALAAVNDSTHGRDHASKVVLLMTDGVHNYGTHPKSAAYSLANSGVTLFAITFSDEADQATMQDVAEMCGGEHFHAINAAQLKEAFQKIARRLPTLITQ